MSTSAATSGKDCRVVVVGGGVIGLTSALALLQQGFKDVRVVAESFEDLTSHVAGGLWMPFALPEDMDSSRPRQWCEVSFAWLENIMAEHAEEAGMHLVYGSEVSNDGPPLVVHPYWAHCVKDFRLLTREEASAVSPDAAHGFSFGTIIYNTGLFMSWLHKEISKLGGTFEQRRVEDLNDVDCDLLVHCTGLAAKKLAGDDTVFPIRGQIIKVNNPKLDKFVASIRSDGTHTYILPRPNGDVVLGGTAQAHNWNTNNNDDDVKGVWERCCQLYPEVRRSEVLGPVAGLRPGREGGVRLEMEPLPTKRGARVIHNYGHGGSGHTLHWGCAQEVVAMATQVFPTELPSKL